MNYSILASFCLSVVCLTLRCDGNFIAEKAVAVVMSTLLPTCQTFVAHRSTEWPGSEEFIERPHRQRYDRRPFWQRYWNYNDGRRWHFDNGRTSVNASIGTSPFELPGFSAGVRHRGEGWSGRGYGNFDAGGNWDMGGSLDFEGDNWNGGINGTADSGGNFELFAGFQFRKRSAPLNVQRFNITLQADPCNFNVYDLDRNNVITMNEFLTIFGSNTNAEHLFSALDRTTGNGIVERNEFIITAPKAITDCEP